MIACTAKHPELSVPCTWWSDHRGHHTAYKSTDFGAHSAVEWRVEGVGPVLDGGVCDLCRAQHGVHARWCTVEQS